MKMKWWDELSLNTKIPAVGVMLAAILLGTAAGLATSSLSGFLVPVSIGIIVVTVIITAESLGG